MQNALPEALGKQAISLSQFHILNSTYDWSIKSAFPVTIN